MKTITIHLEDSEYKSMKEEKGDETWKEALAEGCRSLSGEYSPKMEE